MSVTAARSQPTHTERTPFEMHFLDPPLRRGEEVMHAQFPFFCTSIPGRKFSLNDRDIGETKLPAKTGNNGVKTGVRSHGFRYILEPASHPHLD